MACRQITEPIEPEIAAGVANHAEQIRSHQKKLIHAGNIEHFRMNCDEDRGGGTQSAQCQEPQLRRAIDDHDVVVFLNATERSTHPATEEFLPLPPSPPNDPSLVFPNLLCPQLSPLHTVP